MKACGSDACNQGRGAPCSAGCDDVLSAQAEGARMCGAWPHVGTPTSPGKLTEAELDRHIAEMAVRLRHAKITISTAWSGGGGVEPELDGPYRKTWRQKLRAFWDAVKWG